MAYAELNQHPHSSYVTQGNKTVITWRLFCGIRRSWQHLPTQTCIKLSTLPLRYFIVLEGKYTFQQFLSVHRADNTLYNTCHKWWKSTVLWWMKNNMHYFQWHLFVLWVFFCSELEYHHSTRNCFISGSGDSISAGKIPVSAANNRMLPPTHVHDCPPFIFSN
jgi:hypothetical protein